MMEEQLIYHLIDEGYTNTESSAVKILSVISEEFYEYLLNEALTPEQRAAGRARTARRRAQLGIPEPSAQRSAEIMGNIRQRGAPSAGARPSSTSMRTSTGASLPETGRRRLTQAERVAEKKSTARLNADRRETERLLRSRDPVESQEGLRRREREEKRPTASPTFVNASGQRQGLNVTTDIEGQTTTMIDPKKRRSPVQQRNDTRRDISIGPNASRTGTSIFSRGNNPQQSGQTKNPNK